MDTIGKGSGNARETALAKLFAVCHWAKIDDLGIEVYLEDTAAIPEAIFVEACQRLRRRWTYESSHGNPPMPADIRKEARLVRADLYESRERERRRGVQENEERAAMTPVEAQEALTKLLAEPKPVEGIQRAARHMLELAFRRAIDRGNGAMQIPEDFSAKEPPF